MSPRKRFEESMRRRTRPGHRYVVRGLAGPLVISAGSLDEALSIAIRCGFRTSTLRETSA